MRNKRILSLLIAVIMITTLIPSSVFAAAPTIKQPVITSPAMGKLISQGSTITLKWGSVSGASKYRISVLDTTSGKKVIDNKEVTGTSASLTKSQLTPGHDYKFAVGAYTKEGKGSTWASTTFSVASTPTFQTNAVKKPIAKSDYETYKNCMKAANIQVKFSGNTFDVYTDNKSGGYLYINSSSKSFATVKEAESLFPLVVMGKNYADLKTMRFQVVNLTPALIYGKQTTKILGSKAVGLVIDYYIKGKTSVKIGWPKITDAVGDSEKLIMAARMGWLQHEIDSSVRPNLQKAIDGISVKTNNNVMIITANGNVEQTLKALVTGVNQWDILLDIMEEWDFATDSSGVEILDDVVFLYRDVAIEKAFGAIAEVTSFEDTLNATAQTAKNFKAFYEMSEDTIAPNYKNISDQAIARAFSNISDAQYVGRLEDIKKTAQ